MPELSARRPIAANRLAAVPLVAAVVSATFLVLHSGSRGRGICEREGFTGPGSLSLTPPGARCRGGEPEFEVVLVHPAFWIVAIAVGLAAIMLLQLVRSVWTS